MTSFSDTFRHRCVLVTGATGYLGSLLADRLATVASRVVALTRRETADTALLRYDPLDADGWKLRLEGIDLVFHLASLEHRHGTPLEPFRDLQLNALSTLALLEGCRLQKRPPSVIFTSSANIGVSTNGLIDETSRDEPLTLYAIHKLTSEHYFRVYAKQFDVPSVSLRLANVYGPSIDFERTRRTTPNRMIESAIDRASIRLFANHAVRRDYLYIDDALGALVSAANLDTREGQRYLVGTQRPVAFETFASIVVSAIEGETSSRPEIIYDRTTMLDPLAWRDCVADSTRFREEAGWNPDTTLEEGIARTIRYFNGSTR